MSILTVTQLYGDLVKLAQKNAQQFAEPAMLTIFNANLADAKISYPDDNVLSAVPDAIGQVRIGDLLLRVGQLKAIIESNTGVLLGGA